MIQTAQTVTQQDITGFIIKLVLEVTIPLGIAWLMALISGVTKAAGSWLEAHNQAKASQIVTDISTRFQTALTNSSGRILGKIQDGSLDPTNAAQWRNAIETEAQSVLRSNPDAVKLGADATVAAKGIEGKIGLAQATVEQPAQASAPPLPQTIIVQQPAAPQVDLAHASFQTRVSVIKPRLVKDLSIKDFHASGLLGNLGEESDGLTPGIQERHPVSGRGGIGWGQWTGPRRNNFETFCTERGMQVTDPEANYQFLVYELLNDEKVALEALRATTTLEEATTVVEQKYERAGIARMDRRQSYAQMAQNA